MTSCSSQLYDEIFQSTPPVKAATIHFVLVLNRSQGISIHAAREGGDTTNVRTFWRRLYFNPRRP